LALLFFRIAVFIKRVNEELDEFQRGEKDENGD